MTMNFFVVAAAVIGLTACAPSRPFLPTGTPTAGAIAPPTQPSPFVSEFERTCVDGLRKYDDVISYAQKNGWAELDLATINASYPFEVHMNKPAFASGPLKASPDVDRRFFKKSAGGIRLVLTAKRRKLRSGAQENICNISSNDEDAQRTLNNAAAARGTNQPLVQNTIRGFRFVKWAHPLPSKTHEISFARVEGGGRLAPLPGTSLKVTDDPIGKL